MKLHIWYLLLISFLGFITYANTLGNAFISDDIVIIAENRFITSPIYFLSDPTAIIRPFLYYFIVQLWGLNPIPFHLLNILFHILTACSLYTLAFYMTKKRGVSLIAALIFAVHPALSEGVTWISGGNYPQYGYFMTITILMYILRKKYRGFLWLSVIMFILTLLSSQKAAVILFLVNVFYSQSTFGSNTIKSGIYYC